MRRSSTTTARTPRCSLLRQILSARLPNYRPLGAPGHLPLPPGILYGNIRVSLRRLWLCSLILRLWLSSVDVSYFFIYSYGCVYYIEVCSRAVVCMHKNLFHSKLLDPFACCINLWFFRYMFFFMLVISIDLMHLLLSLSFIHVPWHLQINCNLVFIEFLTFSYWLFLVELSKLQRSMNLALNI